MAVVGSNSISKSQANKCAEKLLSKLIEKYDIKLLATVKDDTVGTAFRKQLRKLGADSRFKTRCGTDLELTTAGLIWDARRFIVVHDNARISGCAKYMMEMLARNKTRRVRIIELE